MLLQLLSLYILLKIINDEKEKIKEIFFLKEIKKEYLSKYKPRKEFDKIKKANIDTFDKVYAFIRLQEGGKSDDPNDPSAKNKPDIPDKDGRYYHTNSGITWKTFKQLSKKILGIEPTPEAFYNLNNEQKKKFVKYFFETYPAIVFGTKNKKINYLLGYFLWAGTNKNLIQKALQSKNKNLRFELLKAQVQHYNNTGKKIYIPQWKYNLAKFYEIVFNI